MVFTPPSWVPKLPFDPPDSIIVGEFWGNERYGRLPHDKSHIPFTCGATGKAYTAAEMRERYELLARSLAKRTGWSPNEETPWDKVVGIFAYNSIDYIMSSFAVHRLSGIATPANAMYSASELEYQLKASGAKALITCVPLLETALKAARSAGIPDDRVFITEGAWEPKKVPFKTLDELIKEGRSLPELEPLDWVKGQGSRQVAYLCFSSGTSGLPKAVMISHLNVIANIMQIRWHDSVGREVQGVETQITLGLLPLSHIYGLVVIALASIYKGDGVIILPRYEFKSLLETIQKYKINYLYLVPPIIIQLLRSPDLCARYDLSSVRYVFTGAAPLGGETHVEMRQAFPSWQIGQGYGMTETSTVILSTSEHDIVVGTSGSLVPGARARVVDAETGQDVAGEGVRGELWVQSPSVTLGYLNNARATAEAFVYDDQGGRWLRTGDVAVVSRSPAGYQHFSIVDRMKELIKVKGHQVPPAELEAHLLSHPAVNDCTVIPVPDEDAGEVPKAYVVKSAAYASKPDEETIREICKHVEDHKARYKWLKGGVAFVDVIPKSPSGKILRRLLRDKDREARRMAGSKL